jgi:hypothetical protein
VPVCPVFPAELGQESMTGGLQSRSVAIFVARQRTLRSPRTIIWTNPVYRQCAAMMNLLADSEIALEPHGQDEVVGTMIHDLRATVRMLFAHIAEAAEAALRMELILARVELDRALLVTTEGAIGHHAFGRGLASVRFLISSVQGHLARDRMPA